MATSPLAPAGAPGKKTAIKVQASMSDVHNIRLMDTDLVIVLKSGKTAVVPDGAIRAMMDPEFAVQFDDTEVAGSALLRQAGRMEIGDLASVAVSTPPPEDAAVWVNGGPAPAATAGKASEAAGVLAPPPAKSFADSWGSWAAIVAAGGGLLALATGGGSKGGSASPAATAQTAPATPPEPFSIFGTITAGPVVASNDLRVEVRDTTGRVLGASTVDANGRYQINGLSGAYTGALLVTVSNTGANDDYVDEATRAGKDLGVALRAAAVRAGESQLQINVTPVTELAVRVMAPADGKAPSDGAAVTHANTAMSHLLGLGDVDITTRNASPVIKQDGGVSTRADDYGRVLALLSGIASDAGGDDAALTKLLGQIDTSGTTYHWKTGTADAASMSAEWAKAFNALPDATRTDALRATLNKAIGAIDSADTIAPTTTGVALNGVDSLGNDKAGKLTAGDKLRVTLSMDESTLVVGSPTVGLDIGGRVVQAVYTTTTVDGRLVFEYVVQPADYAAAGAVRVVGLTIAAADRLADAAGNAVAAALPDAGSSASIAVGTTVPVVSAHLDAADDTGSKSDDGITQRTAVHISITGNAGNTVHLYEDLNGNGRPDAGEALGEAPVQAGTSQATVAVTLTQGHHDLLAYQQDADGLTSAASAPLTVIVDNGAPAQAKLQLTGPDQVTRGGTPFSLAATPLFSITAEKGSQVTVFEDRNGDGVQNADEATLLSHVQTGTVDTVPGTFALSDGLHHLRAITTDVAGNSSVSAIQDIGVATTPVAKPAINLLLQEDTGSSNADGITGKSLLQLQIAAEPGNTVVVFDDLNGNGQLDDGELIGEATAPAQPGSPLSLAASLAEGRHVLIAYQQDANGFTSELSTPKVVVVDKTAPARATLGLSGSDQLTVNGMPVSLNPTPPLQITAEKGARVVVFEDKDGDGVQGAGEQTLADHLQLGSQDEVDSVLALGGGRHDLRVVTTDRAGNRSVSDIQTIGILSKPIATSQWTLAPADDTGDRDDDLITNRSTLHVTVTGDAGNTVVLFDDQNGNGKQDDGEIVAQAVVQDGEAQASLVFNLAPGRHVLRAYQRDVSGLSGSFSAPGTVVVDRTAPAVGKPELGGPDSTTLNGQPVSTAAAPMLELTAEKGSHVSVFEDLNGNGQIDDGEKVLVADHLQIGDRDEVTSAIALGDGSYDLRVVATDAAGNRGVSAIQTISVVATSAMPPTLNLSAADDTGASSGDRITSKGSVAIEVTGTAGTTVKLFNDFNQNGKEDAGESVGAVALTGRDTRGSVTVQLVDGVNHLHAYTVDVLGRKSAPGDDLAITLDQQAPAAPTVRLAADSDTGVVGDQVTALENPTLQISGEAGAQFLVFDDRNGNGALDAGEQLASGTLTDTAVNAQVSLAEGAHALRVIVLDLAGNASAATPFALTVNHSLPTVVPAKAIELDGRALANTDTTDSLMFNSALAGERLTAAHLGLADPAPGDVRITFVKTVNITIAIDGVVQQGTTAVSLQQVIDGHVSLLYSQDTPSLLSSGVFAELDYAVTKPGATTESMDGSLNFAIHHSAGIAVFADGSGTGGIGAIYGNGVTAASAGTGATDQLLGTAHADLIFGDGSGGGAGAGMSATGAGGAAGGAGDTIAVGDGDDIIFGDGFGSSNMQGGYGGGGGGGGSGSTTSPPGGAGGVGAGSGSNHATGGWTTLGALKQGTDSLYGSGRVSGGGGAGIGSGGDYNAEFDGAPNAALHQYDGTGSAASAVDQARSALLDGPGAGNAENRMFTQTMGVGNDHIDGGAGNDFIMAGNGDDVIIGGSGNDIMYGRGGSTSVGTDNDTFVWHRGDAGASGAVDVIRDFGTTSGNQDRLSVLGMLEGRTGPSDDLSQWIHVFKNAQAPQGLAGADAGTTGTLIVIDVDGPGPGQVQQQIYLTGVTLASTDVHTLISNGTIL